MPTVTLACKGGVVLSKPIKHPCFIENLRKVSKKPSNKSFLVLFLEKEHSYKQTNFLVALLRTARRVGIYRELNGCCAIADKKVFGYFFLKKVTREAL